jgi:diphthine-ammonia ligase
MGPGICEHCRHVRIVRSARRSTFWQCERASTDTRFSKYPRLPVSACDGFEAATARLPPAQGAVATFWNAGTGSCLARQRAQLSGYDCPRLVNIWRPDVTGRLHGVDGGLIARQAEVLGATLTQVRVSADAYAPRFEAMLADLRRQSIAGVVFGNVHTTDAQAWCEERTRAAGLAHVEPLRGWPPREVVRQFLAAGFRAVVVSVMRARLDPRWVGESFDETFLDAVSSADGVDACGERGEYHTFVYDGPGFQTPVDFVLDAPIESEGCVIRPARLPGA